MNTDILSQMVLSSFIIVLSLLLHSIFIKHLVEHDKQRLKRKQKLEEHSVGPMYYNSFLVTIGLTGLLLCVSRKFIKPIHYILGFGFMCVLISIIHTMMDDRVRIQRTDKHLSPTDKVYVKDDTTSDWVSILNMVGWICIAFAIGNRFMDLSNRIVCILTFIPLTMCFILWKRNNQMLHTDINHFPYIAMVVVMVILSIMNAVPSDKLNYDKIFEFSVLNKKKMK